MVLAKRLLFSGLFSVATCVYNTCPYTILQKGLSCKLQKSILVATQLQNLRRTQLMLGLVPGQPKAKYLNVLQWDPSLAESAQKVADTCEFEHVKINGTRFKHVGQNLYIKCHTRYTPEVKWQDAVDAWFNEYKLYKYPENPTTATGHYTQLMWENTKYVGCAATVFRMSALEAQKIYGGTRKKDFYCKLYVCNYGPGGNVLGKAPYEKAG